MMEKISDYCAKHHWAYVIAVPILIPYAIYGLFKALMEYGKRHEEENKS